MIEDLTWISYMRIVFVNRFFYPDLSATSQLLTDLATHLSNSGHEVHIVCSRQLYEDAAAHLSSFELVAGVRVHRVAGTKFGRSSLPGRALDYASFYIFAWFCLGKIVTANTIVVAKTDTPFSSVIAVIISR
jgi:hypothetical protein